MLFWIRKRILDFQFTGGFLPFWDLENVLSPGGTLQSRARKGSNCFYLFFPRRDSAKQIPKEVQLFLLMSYFGLGNVYWTFNLQTVFCLFETLKMFYPPKGLCKADTEGGPIVFAYVLFWVRKRILDFQFISGFLPFWDPPNVLSPGGTLRRSRARKGSNIRFLIQNKT